VLCGHFGGKGGEWCQTSINERGGKVIELLSDYQEFSNGGDGWLRILRFDPGRGEIRVRTYSPWLDRCERDRDSEFVLRWQAPG
jgi:hypothetical protein